MDNAFICNTCGTHVGKEKFIQNFRCKTLEKEFFLFFMPHSGLIDHLIPGLPAAVFLEVKLLERETHIPPPSSADM